MVVSCRNMSNKRHVSGAYCVLRGVKLMKDYKWSLLKYEREKASTKENIGYIGRIGELYAIIEFLYHKFEVYSPEIDNKGIDFVARRGNTVFEVQVKSVLPKSYTFIKKDKFVNKDTFLICYIRFIEGEVPAIYIIPAPNIVSEDNSGLFADYTNRENNPEYGIKYNQNEMIEKFRSDLFFEELDNSVKNENAIGR